ncbi:MAG: hypothetical protein CMF25_00960 [Kangiellaceae bacterium]|nr:hypothetical protein [Kangiellaceae bacterium]|tara:strand:- start:931 stop:2922 length:1992 start_codon:yes stop_codon:yes gene_type:complete
MSSFILKHPEKDVDLGVFLPIVGRPFVNALHKSCNHAAQFSISHFNSIWGAIKFLFNELQVLEPELLTEIKNGVSVFGKQASWMKFLAMVHWRLQKRKISNSGKNNYISGLNYILLHLQNRGYIPRFNGIATFKPEKKVSKSLLEFTFDEYEVFGSAPEDEDATEIDKVILSLKSEMRECTSENIADQCAFILKDRLTKLRLEAEEKFIQYSNLRLSGLIAIRKYRYLLPIIDDWLNWRKSKETGTTNPWGSEIRQLSDEQWWGVYLAWCWYRNDGLEPKCGVLPSRLYNMIRKQFSGRRDYRADVATAEAIGCSMGFIAAASTILIHDLVANVDSVRNMSVNADNITDYGVVDVEWVKPRARGLLTAIDERQSRYTASRVIRVIRRSTRRYRQVAVNHHKNKLFLHHHSAKGSSKVNRNQDHVKPMMPSSASLLKYVKNIIHKASGEKWSGTARSIRVSVLLYKGLTGGLISVQQAAQHSSLRTSMLYTNSIVMRLTMDKKMREFREWLQVLVTINIENAASKIGIDEDKYQKEKEALIASQFGGVYCRDPKSGVQEGTQKGEVCGAISQCMTCANKRNIFVVTEENVLHLLQWNEALKKGNKQGFINVFQDGKWAFWCVFIESVIEKIFQSGNKNKAVFQSAQQKLISTDNPYLKIDFRRL